jgi:hypothetical protein
MQMSVAGCWKIANQITSINDTSESHLHRLLLEHLLQFDLLLCEYQYVFGPWHYRLSFQLTGTSKPST